MEFDYLKIAETGGVLLGYILLRVLLFKLIDKSLNERLIQKSRGKLIKRVLNGVLLSLALILCLLIWGVDRADLGVFVGSVLTIVGVAFFAQWSLLSNITSSIILFFNHPVRLHDDIVILEGKDYLIEGKVMSIGIFFITLQTEESETITLPNNIFIQKSIKKVKKTADSQKV